MPCCIYNKKNESERCINQYKLLNELFPYLQVMGRLTRRKDFWNAL